MSQTLPPIRPKPSLHGSEAFSTIDFPVHYTPEPVRNPALPVKDKMNPAPQPMDEIKSSNNVAEHQPVPLAEAFVFQPRNIRQTSNKNDPRPIPMWPSEIHNMSDTTWLLPACSDQAYTLASVLRTEIQSHSITREMLHNTERKRLEGAQRCKDLHADIESWATAHKNLTDTLARCANEFSRLSAENVELKTKLDATPINVPSLNPKQTWYCCCGPTERWDDAQVSSSTAADFGHGRDTKMFMTETYESPCASEFSTIPYSPEV